MIDEARKREKVANAVLGLALAASASQSPKDFVKTGHVEAPGTALMQRFGRVRGEAERNLDSGRVVAKNKKLKTFREFLEEAKSPKPDALETIQRKTKKATPGMKYVIHTTSSGDIRVDDVILLKLTRDTGVANNYPEPVWINGVDIHYQSNKFGTKSKDPPFYT